MRRAARCLLIALFLTVACVSTQTAQAQTNGSITIGSKAFPEGIILGDILATMLRRNGVSVTHRAGLGGTQIVWAALLRGEVDVYADYTGTLISEQLHDAHIESTDGLRQALAQRGLSMSAPLGFSNSYGIAVRRVTAERLHLSKLSDLAAHPEMVIGVGHEFMTRKEGWNAVRARYGLHPERVVTMEHELLYRALAADDVGAINVYTTDGDIGYYDLVVLEDDRHLFPRYDAVYVYRDASAQQCPMLLDALRPLAGGIDETQMIAMNAEVKVQKRAEADVARAFVARRFPVAAAGRSTSGPGGAGTGANRASGSPRASIADGGTAPSATETSEDGVTRGRLLSDTAHHLFLVSLPLLLDICLGVPLGVLASRHPRLGGWIVGVCGVLQTIPSLALLIFMVPLLGIGYKPALVALFIYGLLPILRNTCTGLRDISPPLIESALALGLPARTRLWKIELPLASRAILAGIKTSAVINVGTATIGAIVGAGGYGEPIMMGVRRDDMHLLMQGAIPAACLAIAVQLLFDGIERWIVPRGLRLRDEQEAR